MLKVLLLFLLIMAGIILGPLLAGHQGYVLIQTANYNIETSITAVVILLVVGLVILFVIEWVLRDLLQAGSRISGWFSLRKRRLANKYTSQALLKLAEGDYQQMEKLLTRHAEAVEQPMINYLLAAEAAQQRGDKQRASQHLARAAELAGDDQLPIAITRARLQLARGENHAARHGIDKLLEVAPRHPEVLRLGQQAYQRTEAWAALLEIIPVLRKILPSEEQQYQELEQRAWIGLMNQARASAGSDGLKRWWRQQHRKTRGKVALQVAMAEHLIECDDSQTAQQLILEGIKQSEDERLILLIPRLQSSQPEQLEKALRQQIKALGDRPLLWSTLGQSLLKRGEWQQACVAFRAALKQRPDAFDYAWLADALDKRHQPAEAAAMRQEGLLLTLKNNQ